MLSGAEMDDLTAAKFW